MKRIVLLAVLSLSVFSMACGGDASTCEEAYDNVVSACEGEEGITIQEKSAYVSSCDDSSQKEAQIECSNEDSCGAILACSLKLIGAE